MNFFVGTSGYSYKEWKGNFYPTKTTPKEMLALYAQKSDTVEINNTFYRLPTDVVVGSWAEQVPETFRFVLKARQVITHFRRLQNAEKEIDDFLRVATVLQQRLGTILFQLPPNFKKDVPRLNSFLNHVGGRANVTIEFRHESWSTEEVYNCLRAHSAAMCVTDADDLPATNFISSSNWGYLRLRNESYADDDLKEWIRAIKSQKWNEVYVFFKHEDAGAGPKLARRFLELAAP
jgi:uncharacterized protein YecE (DUF72 family)